jgi:hypothetical protein
VDNERTLFETDPAAEARSRQMNGLILGGARRGEHPTGGGGVLSGESPEHARMNAALASLERAKRDGASEDSIAYLEHVLDRAVETSRAVRQERPRDAQGRFTTNTSGGP